MMSRSILLLIPLCACLADIYDGDLDGFDQYVDCDDEDKNVYPGAPEVDGDGIDNNCDNRTDEGTDADQDGYHKTDPFAPDCNDEDPLVHPGRLEICENGLDDDCDGQLGRCALGEILGLDDVGLLLEGPAGDSRLGSVLAPAGDQDGDGVQDLWVSAPRSGQSTGSVYRVAGGETGVRAATAAPTTLTGTSEGAYFGASLVGGEDLDGDGYADLVIGSPTPGAEEGVADVFLGPVLESIDASGHDSRLIGPDGSIGLGGVMAGLGDIDGDGLAELALGLPQAEGTPGPVGVIGSPVHEGASTLSSGVDADGVWWLLSEEVGGLAGTSLVAADFDGDGLGDLAVGAPLAEEGGERVGAVHILSGGSGLELEATLWGSQQDGWAGGVLASPGDLDDDGYANLLVGAPMEDVAQQDVGVVYLLDRVYELSGELETLAISTWEGQSGGDRLGTALAGLGNFDGDSAGEVDLALAAPRHGGSDEGSVYIFAGPVAEGPRSVAKADYRFDGRWDEGLAGTALLGDVDWSGDGIADLGVGLPGFGSESSGMLLVFAGAGF